MMAPMSGPPATDAGVAAGAGVLTVACVSTLVVNANTSAVSILLPSISRDTGTSIDTLQFAVTGYSMVGAAVIVTSTKRPTSERGPPKFTIR